MNMLASNPSFLRSAEDADGYPSLAFERFYRQGMSCYEWHLPTILKKQAFRKVCNEWKAMGHSVALWQVKAFIYGAAGWDFRGRRDRRIAPSFRWPAPPDPSWSIVVCAYPDGYCDLDMVHAVSRVFWSEHNGFFEPPSEDATLINAGWYRRMGFAILSMQPALRVTTAKQRPPHLRVVKP